MRQGLDTDLEYRIIARDGKIHWLQDRGHFVSDEHGNRTGWQGVILDITETKALEARDTASLNLKDIVVSRDTEVVARRGKGKIRQPVAFAAFDTIMAIQAFLGAVCFNST